MNQQALASVLLRVFGIYVVYSAISILSSSVILQGYAYYSSFPGDTFSLIGMIGAAWLIQLAFGIVLTLFARRISKFFFAENLMVADVGGIDEHVLFHVGICLMGVWFLFSNIPSFLLEANAWFRAQAYDGNQYLQESADQSYDYLPYYTIMIATSLVLIFRGKSLSNWIFKHSK